VPSESPCFSGQRRIRDKMINKQTIQEAVVTLDEIGIEEMDQVIAPGVVIGD